VPGRVFTESERRRLDAFPSEIVESDLIRYFTLSGSDLELVRRQRGDHNRWALPYSYARCVTWGSAPMILSPLRRQPSPSWPISSRSFSRCFAPTERELRLGTGHWQQIQRYLGFHDATRENLRSLANWLLARALEHDKPSLLFQLSPLLRRAHAEVAISG
jgi:hypothetical protein